MLFAVRDYGQAGVAAVHCFVALVPVAPLYLVSLHRIGAGASSVLTSIPLPWAAGVVVWMAGWVRAPVDRCTLPRRGVSPEIAVAFWRRDNLRFLRSAARQGAT